MSGFNHSLRGSFWEWAQTALLGANLAWTTLCLGGYLPQTMVVTAALTAALLLVHAVGLLALREASASHPAGWLFVPFLGYAAANVVWVAPERWLGWFDWFGWAQMIAVFWVGLNGIRSRRAQGALIATLFAVALGSVLLACHQRFVRPDWLMFGRTQAEQYAGRASGSFGIPNSLAALLLLVLPLAGALTFRRGASAVERVFFGWVTAALAFGLGLTISRGAWLGLAVALTVWPLFAGRASARRKLARSALAAAAVVLAGAMVLTASPAARARFTQMAKDAGERSRPILWRAGWRMVREAPVFGTGAGSFNTQFERYRPEGFLPKPQWAHNDYLNTLTDYGAVGFGLFFGAAVVVCAAGLRRRRSAGPASRTDEVGGQRSIASAVAAGGRRPAARDSLPGSSSVGPSVPGANGPDPLVVQALAIGLLAFALQLLVDFHFKIPALAMAFATVAAIVVARRWRVDSPPLSAPASPASGALLARRILGVGLAVAAIAIVTAMIPRYRAEALRFAARESIDRLRDADPRLPEYRTRLAAARDALGRAVVLAPDNGQTWADLAYGAAQWSRLEPGQGKELGRQAEADASRAIALAPAEAESWIRRGVARDLQGRWTEAGDDFTHAITLAPKTPLPWFHYAYHLSLHAAERDLANAMVLFCLRLDPKNPDGLRLRQRLASGEPAP